MDRLNRVDEVFVDGQVINGVVLPKSCEFFKVKSSYSVGEKPEGYQNEFVKEIIDRAKGNPKLIKKAYLSNGGLELELDGSQCGCEGLKKIFTTYFDNFASDLTGIKFELSDFADLEKAGVDVFSENGADRVVSKSPVNLTSLLYQNRVSSAPVHVASEAMNVRFKDKYV